MSFIQNEALKPSYAPGWFLADDEACTRITVTVDASDGAVVTADNGAKYVPMGSVYEGGILYEDVDVSTGDMPGSLVIAGHYYADRVIGDTADITYSGLVSVGDYPSVTRPASSEDGGTGDTGATGDTGDTGASGDT